MCHCSRAAPYSCAAARLLWSVLTLLPDTKRQQDSIVLSPMYMYMYIYTCTCTYTCMCSYIMPTVETLLSTLGEGVCSVSTSVDIV